MTRRGDGGRGFLAALGMTNRADVGIGPYGETGDADSSLRSE